MVRHCLRKGGSNKQLRDQAIEVIVGIYERAGFKKLEEYVEEIPISVQEGLRGRVKEMDEILPEKKKYESVLAGTKVNAEEEAAAKDPGVRVIGKKKKKQ